MWKAKRLMWYRRWIRAISKTKGKNLSLKYLSNTGDGEPIRSRGTGFKPSRERSTISPGCRTLGRRLQLDRQEQDLRVRPGQQTIRIKQDVIKCPIKIPKNWLEGRNSGDQCQGSMLFPPLLFVWTPSRLGRPCAMIRVILVLSYLSSKLS